MTFSAIVQLFQLEGAGWDRALEDFKLKVDTGYHTVTAQHGFHRLASQLGMVVLFAEMAEPDVLKEVGHIVNNSLCTRHVGQMTRA